MFYEDYPEPMPAFAFSGGEDHGRALLESALAEPRQTFGGRYLHRTIYDKAAALFRSLVKDHPLYDGNKRLALACLSVFLLLNWVAFYTSREEAARFAVRVASEEIAVPEIASWIRRHSIPWGAEGSRTGKRGIKTLVPSMLRVYERLIGRENYRSMKRWVRKSFTEEDL